MASDQVGQIPGDVSRKFRLDGRTAFITGAGRGIGRGFALLAAQHGAKVIVK